ncbi:MAG: poly(A) polymerase [Oleiphilaceae bacterium]|jgi:poly(A) polymerase
MPDLNPNIVPRDQHSVSRNLISPSALKVMHRLHSKGYEAFLVGGGVRDILLGTRPKDFDISTNAHPEQVHALFKNSRLIGRRFKLVHILFGREMIEVATFRGKADEQSNKSDTTQSEHGMLLRDNVYGTVEEDAVRRDFTVNALYYSPQNFCVYDFLDGLKDIKAQQLRIIGDPETRYREDPVRMLRALRFAAKLNFEIEPGTSDPIIEMAPLLGNIPPARLFDEMLKLFLSGHAVDIFESLVHYQLFDALFPHISHTLHISKQADYYKDFILKGLNNTDIRIKAEKPVTPAFLYATLIWPEVHRKWHQLQSEGVPEFPALQQAGQQAIQNQLAHISIPKRFTLMMKEIWEYQIRLTKTQGRRPFLLIEQPRFRAAYDFLLLRGQAGEDVKDLGEWWTQFQVKNPAPVHKKAPRRFKNTKPRPKHHTK